MTMATATPISHNNTSPKVFALISASTHCAGRAAAQFDSSVVVSAAASQIVLFDHDLWSPDHALSRVPQCR
jgi:hypothetical protein